MDKYETDLLTKDGKKVTSYGYFLEKIYQKIDSGSDIIINTMSRDKFVVGRPISVSGSVVTVATEDGEVSVSISDILDIG
jgi:O-acetylhomoserine/O-acetylserine sulfhydrylase-like pyridoxal-dependent enzyme